MTVKPVNPSYPLFSDSSLLTFKRALYRTHRSLIYYIKAREKAG